MTGFGAGRVIRSENNAYQIGDIVLNPFCPVAEYSIVPVDHLRKVDTSSAIPLPEYLSALGNSFPYFTIFNQFNVIQFNLKSMSLWIRGSWI